MWKNAGLSQHCRLSEMVDSSCSKYCAKLSFLFLAKLSSSKNGCGDSVSGCTHRYAMVRIASSSWRIWSPGFQFSGSPLFSHSVPHSGLSVSIFRSLYCSEDECHLGCSSSIRISFPAFLCPTVSPTCSMVGLEQKGGVGSHYCRSHFWFFS